MLAVTGLVLVAAVLAGIVRRAQNVRQVRRIERLVTRSVLDALADRYRHGEAPGEENQAQGRPATADRRKAAVSSTDRVCNWLVVLCLCALAAGIIGSSEHLTWAAAVGLLLIPLAAAPILTRRQRTRGSPTGKRGWSRFDTWWRVFIRPRV